MPDRPASPPPVPETLRLPAEPTGVAPDGSEVRVLLTGIRGGLAHFELAAGRVSRAIRHKTVEEIWYIVGGRGRMWRRLGGTESTVDLEPGVCLTIPTGTHFQFRADGAPGDPPLQAIGATMPPWPGPDEAVFVDGHPAWSATHPD